MSAGSPRLVRESARFSAMSSPTAAAVSCATATQPTCMSNAVYNTSRESASPRPRRRASAVLIKQVRTAVPRGSPNPRSATIERPLSRSTNRSRGATRPMLRETTKTPRRFPPPRTRGARLTHAASPLGGLPRATRLRKMLQPGRQRAIGATSWWGRCPTPGSGRGRRGTIAAVTSQRRDQDVSAPEPGEEPPIIPAATVVVLRDHADGGVEALMVRRNTKLEFAGGMWVFPGGRVDEGDRAGLAVDDAEGAARRAAVREAAEEAGVELDADALVWFSHWTPPPIAPKRFGTYFFATAAPDGGSRGHDRRR